MQVRETLGELDPLDIVLFHVGGVGGYGPVRKVIDAFPHRVVAVCFEADPSEKDLTIQGQYRARGVRTLFVPKCIGETNGTQTFYVNKRRASNSVFPVAPRAAGEHVPYPDVRTWGENSEVDHTAEVDLVTLDALIADGTLPDPDILSMDCQGSEMPILRGGARAVGAALCVVCEVDLIELYQGQDLFHTQQEFLLKHGYRLAELLNPQYWHPGPAAGKGFLTVAEALYFRMLEHDHSLSPERLIKLAAIAHAFERTSYASQILGLALERHGDQAGALLVSEPSFKSMLDQYHYMQQHSGDYLKNGRFFYKDQWKKDVVASATSLRHRAGALWGRVKRAARR